MEQRNRIHPAEQQRRLWRGFAGVLATRIVQVKPRDVDSYDVVERSNLFLDTYFLPLQDN
ncbi:hypothetical protein [Pseudarthrobacter oxydans]|uniref:hypothetical protein n=1 Tax=Pseudarthrobacter oxydans TaxID=1671 RepID=UPI002AA62EEE|nr:hypothetical protein [Pseudarthrobacter oxydans]WPU09495.1 hypothetical protein SMD14_00340 [Pseudarthrobacter oxydans]